MKLLFCSVSLLLLPGLFCENPETFQINLRETVKLIYQSFENLKQQSEHITAFLSVFEFKYQTLEKLHGYIAMFANILNARKVETSIDLHDLKNRTQSFRNHMVELEKKMSTRIKNDFMNLRQEIMDIIFNYQSPIRCPRMSYRFGAECLSYEQGARNWSDARSNCKDQGGDLATLDFSELPLELLPKVIPELNTDLLNVKVGLYANIFIGGLGVGGNSKWKWISGYPLEMTDTRWFVDQPDMLNVAGQRCLSLRIANEVEDTQLEFGFDDISCGFVSTSICEYPHMV